MKSIINFLFVMLLISNAIRQELSTEAQVMIDPETEVLEVVKRWNESFSRNDVDTYFGYIHDNLSLFIPSSPYRIDGKKDDREEFEWSLGRDRSRVQLFQELQPKVQMLGERSAVVTYHNRGAYGPEGEEQMAYLKETNVLVKEGGEWKIVHIHVSR